VWNKADAAIVDETMQTGTSTIEIERYCTTYDGRRAIEEWLAVRFTMFADLDAVIRNDAGQSLDPTVDSGDCLAIASSHICNGLPDAPLLRWTLHEDNETIVQERIYLDKADKNLLHDDITTIDHALTRPWRVTQTFRRIVSDKRLWFGHEVCGEGNAHVGIGKRFIIFPVTVC
jgi:hypothetical protein